MPSEEKNYEQSALGKRVNELMDDGYDFGEAVKQAMSEGLKDGGSVGIEILFGPKVPAAPSQLVSESDILLGYRGDAAYRSGSEQSKSIGQGNVGSKASFGGGQGRDRSGRSEGAGGAQVSRALEAQRLQNIANQNKSNSTIDTMKNVYGIVSPFINPGSNLGKVKNIFDVYNLYKNRPFTEEDMTLGMGDNPLPSENLLADATTTPTGGKLGLNLMDYGTLNNAGYTDAQIEELQNNPNINTEEVIRDIKGPIFAAADGGRVGFFMGGPALEGEALSIYNSMSAYGNDDQTIADRLQALGMYTPPGSTPDPTPDPGQTIGYQGGGGGGGITTLDPLTRKSTPMDPNSFLGKTFSKIGDFTGSMMDKFSGTKVGEGITEGATKFKNIALTPMMALMQKRNPLNPAASNYSPSLQPQMNFLEGITGSRITGTSDNLQFTDGQMMIGRDPNSGLTKYGPGSVLSGQNVVSGFGTNDYEKALNKYLTRMNTYTNPTKFQLEKIKQAEAELKAEQERQAQATLASKLAAAQREIDAKGYKDYGQGGASQATQDSYAGSDGSYAGQGEASDWGGGEKDGGIIGYRNGGLATMFTRRR